jgi:hypothetical protein
MAFSLQRLATFGSSIGATVASTYQAVNPSTVPNTNIPQSSYNVLPPGTQKTDTSKILLFVLIGLAAAFGIRYLRR